MTNEIGSHEYVRVASQGEVAQGNSIVVPVGRYEVALFNVAGEYYAYENACPHQGGPIGEGLMEDGIVTCPWHAWCFDLRTGYLTIGHFAALVKFGVRIEGDDVLVSSAPLPEERA